MTDLNRHYSDLSVDLKKVKFPKPIPRIPQIRMTPEQAREISYRARKYGWITFKRQQFSQERQ